MIYFTKIVFKLYRLYFLQSLTLLLWWNNYFILCTNKTIQKNSGVPSPVAGFKAIVLFSTQYGRTKNKLCVAVLKGIFQEINQWKAAIYHALQKNEVSSQLQPGQQRAVIGRHKVDKLQYTVTVHISGSQLQEWIYHVWYVQQFCGTKDVLNVSISWGRTSIREIKMIW